MQYNSSGVVLCSAMRLKANLVENNCTDPPHCSRLLCWLRCLACLAALRGCPATFETTADPPQHTHYPNMLTGAPAAAAELVVWYARRLRATSVRLLPLLPCVSDRPAAAVCRVTIGTLTWFQIRRAQRAASSNAEERAASAAREAAPTADNGHSKQDNYREEAAHAIVDAAEEDAQHGWVELPA